MKSIWKFPIIESSMNGPNPSSFSFADELSIEVPVGAQVLTAQLQGVVPCLWMLVDPEVDAYETWTVRIVGTGHLIGDDVALGDHAGTFQLMDGALVLHVFASKG